MMQQGTFLHYMGDDSSLYAFERIRKGEKLPTCFILHGKEDKVAPVGGSERLVDLIRRVSPDVKVHLELVEGEDHGLDVEWRLGHQNLKAGLELIVSEWLR
jgi:predicted esterase